MNNCSNCKFWEKRAQGDVGHRMGFGKCSKVPMYFEATNPKEMYDPEHGADDRDFKAEFAETKAIAVDGSGYRADLVTAPDFGCVLHAHKSVPLDGQAQA